MLVRRVIIGQRKTERFHFQTGQRDAGSLRAACHAADPLVIAVQCQVTLSRYIELHSVESQLGGAIEAAGIVILGLQKSALPRKSLSAENARMTIAFFTAHLRWNDVASYTTSGSS